MIGGRLLRTAHMAGTTYVESGCGQRAAAISYHVLFSLVPFLAILLTVIELLLPDSAHDRVVAWLVGVAPLPIDVSTSVEGAISRPELLPRWPGRSLSQASSGPRAG